MIELTQDPAGPYGEVLRLGPLFSELQDAGDPGKKARTGTGEVNGNPANNGAVWGGTGMENIIGKLEHILSEVMAEDFKAALKKLNTPRLQVRTDETALLIIDPQRSFTSGTWKRSQGSNGELEVMPIQVAFDNCASLLKAVYHRVEVMFTRCPFPPDSYDWDERFDGIIDPDQLYFIKPGNSVLLPASNGFREWVEAIIKRGRKTLVMGGCTLNSCLRVSALETLSSFRDEGLEVVVDLSICGARVSNYVNSAQFGGMSAVESALRDMSGEGVKVAQRVEWL